MKGNMHIYKAWLVTEGFTQKHGIDYSETFLLVVMLKSIWIILTVITYHDYEIWRINVEIAFLNGNLVKDVYMTQPNNFVINSHANKVCKL